MIEVRLSDNGVQYNYSVPAVKFLVKLLDRIATIQFHKVKKHLVKPIDLCDSIGDSIPHKP